jgi:SAM-dependent methyltransferase
MTVNIIDVGDGVVAVKCHACNKELDTAPDLRTAYLRTGVYLGHRCQRGCPVCGGFGVHRQMITPTGQNIDLCIECGMVFASNLVPVDYSKESIYASPTYQDQTRHRRAVVRSLLNCMIPRKNPTVLDVGCATGDLLQVLRECGFNPMGVSVSEAEVEYCQSRNLNAELLDWEKIWAFDRIFVSHVLEHVLDVSEFLGNLRRWVNPSGRVYVEVPDVKGYGELTSVAQGFNREHINHFSLTTLLDCMKRNGFHALDAGTDRFDVPVVWGVFGRGADDRLTDYVSKLNSEITAIAERMKQLPKAAVWGLGETASILDALGCFKEVVATTDSNPVFHGTMKFGVKAVSPVNFNPPPDVPIVVCSQLAKDSITESIKSRALANELIYL